VREVVTGLTTQLGVLSDHVVRQDLRLQKQELRQEVESMRWVTEGVLRRSREMKEEKDGKEEIGEKRKQGKQSGVAPNKKKKKTRRGGAARRRQVARERKRAERAKLSEEQKKKEEEEEGEVDEGDEGEEGDEGDGLEGGDESEKKGGGGGGSSGGSSSSSTTTRTIHIVTPVNSMPFTYITSTPA
jgi:uncharacterized membrane protein YgcG